MKLAESNTDSNNNVSPSNLSENVNVLLVEDNRINTLVATNMLNEIGLGVSAVKDGQEALDILANSGADQPFTLVLMDCPDAEHGWLSSDPRNSFGQSRRSI